MSDDRFMQIEIKLAEQEDALRVLNEVVIRQAAQIDRLQSLTGELRERLDRIGDGAGAADKLSPADEVPPHY